MDLNYNISILNEKLDEIFKRLTGRRNNKKLKQLIDDFISKEDSKILDKNEIDFLSSYSKDTIRLIAEKRILLAIENKALANRQSYWLALKDRAPKISKNILAHYYDYFIEDINKEFIRYKTRTIDEINKVYDKEIKKSLSTLNENLDNVLSNASSINLDHMENLNSNGRVLSVDGVRKGGLFLSKDSNISYGKFVNKYEFLTMINKMESKKFKVNNGVISKEDLKSIVDTLNQRVNISKNEKIQNQDARSITVGEENKKAGTLFFGKKGLDLPNGEYVSVEEINTAINQFINGKNKLVISKEENKKEFKIVQVKGKIRKFAATAAMAVSMLVASVTGKETNIKNTVTVEQEDNMSSNTNNITVATMSTLENKIEEQDNNTVYDGNIDQTNQELLYDSSSELNLEENYGIQEVNNIDESSFNNFSANSVFENNIVKEPMVEEQSDIVEEELEPSLSENNIVNEIVTEPMVSQNSIPEPNVEIQTVSQNSVSENKIETVSQNSISENKVEKPIDNTPKVSIEREIEIKAPVETQQAVTPVVEVQPVVEPQPVVAPTIETPVVNIQPTNNAAAMLGITPEQLDIVKATIRHEAGNNPAEMANVASCVKNRMNDGRGNAYQVIIAPKQFASYYNGGYKKYTGGNYYEGDPAVAAQVDKMLDNILLGITPPTHAYREFRAPDSPIGQQFENGGNKYR